MAHFVDLDSPDDRALLARMFRTFAEKYAAENPTMGLEFATVTGHGTNPDQTFASTLVQLAGDSEVDQTEIVNLLPTAPRPGDRVGVLRVPPLGAYAVGTIEDQAAFCGAIHAMWVDPLAAGWQGYDRLPLTGHTDSIDFDDGRAALECGFELIDGDDDGYLDSIVMPSGGVFVGSASCKFIDQGTWQLSDRLFFEVFVEYPGGDTFVLGEDSFQVANLSPNFTEVYVHNVAAQPFYAPAGSQVYARGTSDRFTPPPPNGDFANNGTTHGLSVWPLCCSFVPMEPLEDTTTDIK